MPFITFMWYPSQDSDRVFRIQDDLTRFADQHDVGFYVNGNEGREEEPVVFADDVTLAEEASTNCAR